MHEQTCNNETQEENMGEQYMNQGFLIMAKTQTDQRAACACAVSIKNNNPDASVTLVVDNIINLNEEDYDDMWELFKPYSDRSQFFKDFVNIFSYLTLLA